MSVGAVCDCLTDWHPSATAPRLESRRTMATARTSFPRPNLPQRPLRTARRTVVVLAGAIAVSAGIAFVPQAASAAPDAPATSQEAAQLMATRAHDLEVVTE